MARVLVLAQRRLGCHPVRAMCRGVFTQKKKLWEVMEGIFAGLEDMRLLDDVTGKTGILKYGSLCSKLKTNGRAVIVDEEGSRVFLIIETEMNKVRSWDVNEQGDPVANPS